MEKIVVVVEKPAIARALADPLRKRFPQSALAVVFAPFVFGVDTAIVPRYPRGLKLKDYPRVSAPIFELNLDHEMPAAFKPKQIQSGGTLFACDPSIEPAALIRAADRIICATDPDASGASAFETLITLAAGSDRLNACEAITLYALDAKSIEKAFDALSPYKTSPMSALAAQGLVKRYFDWNWNVNGLAIFGNAMRLAGVPADAPPLSKYALQLLYALRDGRSLTEGGVYSLMADWPGTGRYTQKQPHSVDGLGSAASRNQILANLRAADLLQWTEPQGPGPDEKPRSLVRISDRGLALLTALHPDCEDPDLPFRLADWCAQGDEAYAAIFRYLRTFFGKQLRFMRR